MTKYQEYKYLNRLTTIFESIVVIVIWFNYGWKFGILSFLGILIVAGIYIRLGYLKKEVQPIELWEVINKVNND